MTVGLDTKPVHVVQRPVVERGDVWRRTWTPLRCRICGSEVGGGAEGCELNMGTAVVGVDFFFLGFF